MFLKLFVFLLILIVSGKTVDILRIRPAVISVGTDWNSEVLAFLASDGLLYWTDVKKKDVFSETNW